MDRRSPAEMRGIDVDLHDLLRFGIILRVGEIAAQADDQIGILQRLDPRPVAEDAVYPDIIGVVRFEKFLRPRGVHHRGLHPVAKGDDLRPSVTRAYPGIDGHLARSIDKGGKLRQLRIVRAADRFGAIDLPIDRVRILLGKHVPIHDDDRDAPLRQRRLCGLGHDAPRLRRVRDIFAEMGMLLVDLLLFDLLREIEPLFRAGDI